MRLLSGSNEPPVAFTASWPYGRAMYTNQNILRCGEHTRLGCRPRRLGEVRVCYFAPSPFRQFAPRTFLQPVDLTFLTLFNLENSLPNPLISRVCTPLHVNQIFFHANPLRFSAQFVCR